MKYILIAFLKAASAGGGVSAEFEDLEACEGAKAKIEAEFSGGLVRSVAWCFPSMTANDGE